MAIEWQCGVCGATKKSRRKDAGEACVQIERPPYARTKDACRRGGMLTFVETPVRLTGL